MSSSEQVATATATATATTGGGGGAGGGIVCLANLFELILCDSIKYHVVQSAINASLHPSSSTLSASPSSFPSGSNRLYELSKSSTFKDLLHEAKLTTNDNINTPISTPTSIPLHTNPLIPMHEGTWKWYKFDPDEPDLDPPPYASSSSSSCRYDDPHLYEDEVDDTDADQEGEHYRVCAAKGVYMVHVGSFHVSAPYPSSLVLSVNERMDRLHFHFYHYAPSPYDPDSNPRALPSGAKSFGMPSLSPLQSPSALSLCTPPSPYLLMTYKETIPSWQG